MPQLIKQGRIVSEAAAPELPLLADYLQAPGSAVKLLPADDIEPLLPHLAKLSLIAVDFPSTGEGRGYTQGRLLRERHGYRGELRAVGKVRVDQVWFLARCGFDAFELFEGEDPQVAIAQLNRFTVAYQSTPDGLTHPRHRYGGR